MFLSKLIEKYQVTAGELRKLGVEWKGKGKPGAKQTSKKSAKNVVEKWKKDYGDAMREAKKAVNEKTKDEDGIGGERLTRIKESLEKIEKLMKAVKE